MATVQPTKVFGDDKRVTVTWTGLTFAGSDVGDGVYVGDMEDLAIQAVSATATDTCVIQGSQDNSTWDAIGSGVTLTATASTGSQVAALSPKPLYIRPSTPSANSMTIILSGTRVR